MQNIMIPQGYFVAVGRLRFGRVAFLCIGKSVGLQCVIIDRECACFFIEGVLYDGRPLSRELVDNLGTCQFAESHADIGFVGYGGDRQGPPDIRPG